MASVMSLARRVLWRILAAIGVLGAGTGPASADVTYSFYGTCVDCTLSTQIASPTPTAPGPFFVASLTLTGYVPGTPLSPANFVSFTYGGSNLVPGFTYSGTPSLPFVGLTGALLALLGLDPEAALPSSGAAIPVALSPEGFELTLADACVTLAISPIACDINSGDLIFGLGTGAFAFPALYTAWNLGGPTPADYGLLTSTYAVARVVNNGGSGSVPVPATLALLGLGLAGLGFARRRKVQ